MTPARNAKCAARSVKFIGAVLAFWLIAAGPAVEVRNANDPVNRLEARAAIDADRIRLSGEVTLVISVEGPAPLAVTPAKPLLTRTNVWRVREHGLPIREVLPGGRESWSHSYRLSPLATGRIEVPLGPLTVRAGTQAEQAIAWDQRNYPSVDVSTTIAAASVDSLRPPTDIEQLPPPSLARGSLSWWFAFVPGLLMAALFLLILARRRRPCPVPRDVAWAVRELSASRFSPEQCAVVLRQFIAYRHGVQAETRTTPELAAELRSDNKMTDSEIGRWQELLAECDVGRFSGVEVSVAGLADRAIELVQSTQIQTTAPTSAVQQ